MASALEKLRKARQGSATSLAAPALSSGTTGIISSGNGSGGSALAKLRAARSNTTSSSGLVTSNSLLTPSTGGSALAKLRSARTAQSLTPAKTQLTPAAQLYASDEEKKRQQNAGGLLGGAAYTLEKAGIGIIQGVEGIVDYAVGGLAEFFGNDSYSEEVFANDWLDYNHADTWYNPSEGWKFIGDVASGIGTSLPGIAAGAAVTLASGGTGLATGVGLAVSAFSAAGTSTKEAYLESGELTGKQFGYGALMGGIEAATEKVSGALGAGLGKAISSISSALGKSASKTAARVTVKGVAKQLGKEFLGEAFEEGTAEILSPIMKRLTYNKDAELATPDEIAYAAIVGGLSGVVMGGVGMGSRSVRHLSSGTKISDTGKVAQTLELGQMYADVEANEATGSATIKAISEIMGKIGDVKDGTKLTAGQRRMLGELQEYTTVAPLENIMQRSAISALRGAQPIAAKLASDGAIKLVDGKLTTGTADAFEKLRGEGKQVRDITAEDITKGYDPAKPTSIFKALQDNEVLRYVSASDAAGRLILSASQVEESALRGRKIRNQVDLNKFIEETNKDPERRAALGKELGIADNEWDTLQIDRFNQAIDQYEQSGKAEANKIKFDFTNKAKTLTDESAKKKIPSKLSLGDGKIQRYKTDKIDIAVAREGDSFLIYDYNLKETSRVLTRAEANTALNELKTAGEVNIPTETAPEATITPAPAVDTEMQTPIATEPNSKVTEVREKLDAKKIDTYARENITDYDGLSEQNKSMIRKVVREGRALGVADADVLSSARIAARTGVNVEFDSNMKGDDAAYFDPDTNKIVINPKAEKKQELLLIHELDHAVRAYLDDKGTVRYVTYKNADKKLSDETWNHIKEHYADQDINVSREELLADEASAYYTEAILGGKGAIDLLLGEEPTLQQKILSFFSGAAQTYSKDAHLSKEARKHYRQFKKMFNAFAEVNKGMNAFTAEEMDAATTLKGEKNVRTSKDVEAKLAEYKKPITLTDVLSLRAIGRKSINDFTSAEIDTAGKWAYKFYNELHEKSPFFRAWFGDWRSEQKNEFVKIAKIPKYIGTNEARKQNRGTVKNNDTEWNIRISREGETNTISHAGDERLSEYGLSGIRSLIENAIFLDSEVHDHHNNNATDDRISFDHKLYALGESNTGGIALYKITIEEQYANYKLPNDKRFHNLRYVTKIADSVGSLTHSQSRGAESTNDVSATYSISDLFEFVKTYDKEFNPKPVNPLLLNEDGTPKKLYHGTRAQFTTFELQAKPKFGRALGDGFYFTSDYDKAFKFANGLFSKGQDRGGIIMPVYLQMRNPYVIEADADRTSWAKEYRNGDYDGIIDLKNNTYYVEKQGQIKSATDNIGTFDSQSKDIRRSTNFEATLADNNPDKVVISKGKAQKQAANYKSDKVYSKKDVVTALDGIEGFGNLPEDVREEIFRDVWVGLNSYYDKSRRKVFIDVMRYKIPYTLMTNALSAQNMAKYKKLLAEKAKAKKTLDGDALSAKVAEINRKIGELQDAPDRFFDTYDEQRMREINREIGEALVKLLDSGSPSLKAKMESEFNVSDAGKWKAKYYDALGRNKKLLNLSYQIRKMKDLQLGTFLNATDYKNEIFKETFEILGSIEFRGNISTNKVRKAMKKLSEWYKADNPVLKEIDGVPGSGYYSDYMALSINDLATGDANTALSVRELDMLDDVLRHATRIVENFNRIWKNGKWVDSGSTANGFVDVAKTVNLMRASADMRKLSRFFSNASKRYLTAFGDPMTVFRYMDGYQDGFFTWAGEELRQGAFRHGVDVMEMKTDYDAFLDAKDHKDYLKKASKEAVKYGGVELSKLQYISLYMTMQRQQAQRGLAYNGFSFIDLTGKRVEVDGFLSRVQERLGAELGISKDADGTWVVSDEQMNRATEAEIAEMKKKLTAEDLQFVDIIERTLNGKCKDLKTSRDMERLGYSNTISGYYYPIVRAMIAKTIDSRGMWGELDRASNISANKNTVRGAANALWIESVDTVFNRHIDAVARYAELSPTIDAINKIFNLDVSGNKNKPLSVRTATYNTWQTNKFFGGTPSDAQKHNGEAYLKELLADLQGIGKDRGVLGDIVEGIRGGFAVSALAANPKVLVTQLSSLFASTNILSKTSIISGMQHGFGGTTNNDVDTYCPIAKLRNYDSAAAKAQGVLDNVRGIGEKLMSAVSFMDRSVVRMLWGACQTEIESTKGHKVGTEQNKAEAGKLLEKVLLETQQNSVATEKSAAMRSTNMLAKSVTMFTSDAMKGVGRVIDAFGNIASIKARIKMSEAKGDKAQIKALNAELEQANEQARKSVGAIVMTALYMTLIARAFSWLYAKEEDEENPVLAFFADVFGGMLGGLPIISDIYDFFTNGYEISDSVFDTLNDVLTGFSRIGNTAAKCLAREATLSELNGAVLSGIQSICTIIGIPFRNIRNTIMGLTRRVLPNAAYRLEILTEAKSYGSDFNKALEAGDESKAYMILELLLSERLLGEGVNASFDDSAYITEVLRLENAGYSVLPRTIGDTITIDGAEIDLTPEEQTALRARYAEGVLDIEALIRSAGYASLTDDQKQVAIKFIYDSYYDAGIYELYGYERNMKRRIFSKIISSDKIALAYTATSGIESTNKRKSVIAAINRLPLTSVEKLFIVAYKGYTIKDGDIRGVSAARAKTLLSNYARRMGLTSAELNALEQYL